MKYKMYYEDDYDSIEIVMDDMTAKVIRKILLCIMMTIMRIWKTRITGE